MISNLNLKVKENELGVWLWLYLLPCPIMAFPVYTVVTSTGMSMKLYTREEGMLYFSWPLIGWCLQICCAFLLLGVSCHV